MPEHTTHNKQIWNTPSSWAEDNRDSIYAVASSASKHSLSIKVVYAKKKPKKKTKFGGSEVEDNRDYAVASSASKPEIFILL